MYAFFGDVLLVLYQMQWFIGWILLELIRLPGELLCVIFGSGSEGGA